MEKQNQNSLVLILLEYFTFDNDKNQHMCCMAQMNFGYFHLLLVIFVENN